MKAIVLGLIVVLMSAMDAYAGSGLFPLDTLANRNFAYKDTRAWRVHRACKISGWTAFGVGGSMMIVGFVGHVLANWEKSSDSYNYTFRTIGYIGTGLTAASIPLFVFARRQKRAAQEALSLSMGSTVIQTLTPSGRIGSAPAWALRVCF